MVDLIEVVAKAIAGEEYQWKDDRERAAAGFAAIDRAGYVVVPKVPTEAMLEAARIADPMYDDPPTSGATYYSEMLAAAPKVIP